MLYVIKELALPFSQFCLAALAKRIKPYCYYNVREYTLASTRRFVFTAHMTAISLTLSGISVSLQDCQVIIDPLPSFSFSGVDGRVEYVQCYSV